METEKQNKFYFLDVPISIYGKTFFNGVYSNFQIFSPSFCKFGMTYTLVYRCFYICSDWKIFHTELTFLKKIFRKND